MKAKRYGSAYSEAGLIGLLMEGLHEAIRDTVSSYCAENPEADFNKLAHYTASVARLTGKMNVTPIQGCTALKVETPSDLLENSGTELDTL